MQRSLSNKTASRRLQQQIRHQRRRRLGSLLETLESRNLLAGVVQTLEANTPPIADAGGVYSVQEGTQLQLDASGSSDAEDANIALTFEWDLDYDGVNFDVDVQGELATTTFDDDFASRNIALRVTDSEGLATIDLTTLEVTNVNVAFDAGANATLNTIDVGAFTRSNVSFADPGNDTWSGTVDFGDGSGETALTIDSVNKNFDLNHSYTAAGTYTVTVSLTDDDGEEVIDTFEVNVPAPEVSFSAASYLYNEDGTAQSVEVTLTRQGVTGEVTSGEVTFADGTAVGSTTGASADFSNLAIPFTFAENQTETTVTLPITNDLLLEGNEILTLSISGTSNMTIGSQGSTQVTIVDDDTTIVSNLNDSGVGSLRQAILVANANVGINTVSFAISGSGTQSIQLTTALPTITDPIIIDGTTQTGFVSTPLVELRGDAAGTGAVGLRIEAGSSTIRGLIINRFSGGGIRIIGSSGSTIAGNYIGTDASGSVAQGNGGNGIFIQSSTNNIIGGDTVEDRNVISGNGQYGVHLRDTGASGNFVIGNYIGTNATGTGSIANALSGVIAFNAVGNFIGGTGEGEENVISGNTQHGVYIVGSQATDNVVLGNHVGVDAEGTVAIANGRTGIFVQNASDNQIGGTTVDSGNVVSGNALYGISIEGATATLNRVEGNIVGLNATATASIANGTHGIFVLNAPNNHIGGLLDGAGNTVSGNAQHGIYIRGSVTTGTTIEGNRVGTDSQGEVDFGNGLTGIFVYLASDTSIGGGVPGAANIISGNGQNGISLISANSNNVLGNHIGVDVDGTAAIANAAHGIYVENSASNTIGGSAGIGGNIISGNGQHGVYLRDAGSINNIVLGNFIGTSLSGEASLGNGASGVFVYLATDNTIGSSLAASGNVISGNAAHGVYLSTTNSNEILGNRIGTNVLGTVDLGNNLDGIYVLQSSLNVIGGASDNQGNHISGNNRNGINLEGPLSNNNKILGNLIGANAAGTAAIGNSVNGVYVLNAPDNQIGGALSGEGNLISGNLQNGVYLRGSGTTGTVVSGNNIGLNLLETAAVANVGSGIYIFQATNNIIGGDSLSKGNIISGNGQQGIYIVNASGITIDANLIGTNSLNANLGNTRNGVLVENGTSLTIGGDIGNTIAFNKLAGVRILGDTSQVELALNSFNSNVGLGIDIGTGGVNIGDPDDLDTGANGLQNAPVLSSAVVASGLLSIDFSVLSSVANATYPLRIEFYKTDAAGQEGRVYLGQTTYLEADAQGVSSVQLDVSALSLAEGDRIVAIATDAEGNSSEFSGNLAVTFESSSSFRQFSDAVDAIFSGV